MGFSCQSIGKTFATRNGSVQALAEVDFSAAHQDFICIVGPSGCGKTTLLKLIGGLMRPSEGRIEFSEPAATGRPRSAMVFQEHGLFPWMSIVENVAFGLEAQGVARRERRERARAFLEQVGLGPFSENYPHELSVGMRQRAGIARAFVTDPEMLLMDEPLGSLDAQTKQILREELLRIWQQHRKLVVHVTHDIEEALLLGDRVLVMTGRPGRIREDIRVPFERPRDPANGQALEFAALKLHIWKLIEEEVRKSQCIRSEGQPVI